jgi:hypothetical protein
MNQQQGASVFLALAAGLVAAVLVSLPQRRGQQDATVWGLAASRSMSQNISRHDNGRNAQGVRSPGIP